jgi:23S rRNA (cytosine1962-C5)-methyltransferase
MTLIRTDGAALTLRLGRDLVRVLKRGHPWVFAEALRCRPDAPPGTPAILLDSKRGRPVARGFYDPTSPVAFRACTVDDREPLDDAWAQRRLDLAWQLRQRLFDDQTTGYRLFNGEGDGLPGLVADVYGDTAVLRLDGDAAAGFWHTEGVAEWLVGKVGVRAGFERPLERGGRGRILHGQIAGPVPFLENGIRFTADVVSGQKTGFFLDQRDNRLTVRRLAAGLRVLNLFGYTGGFSVSAGVGAARAVATVDSAAPAVAVSEQHWTLNGLPADGHRAITADAFEFLDAARREGERWGLVVIDPPSFAPSQSAVTRALASYQRLAYGGAVVTEPHGMLALGSCSSHVSFDWFLAAASEGIAQARRRATVLGLHSQPADHPTPLALPEFRYLKFVILRVH